MQNKLKMLEDEKNKKERKSMIRDMVNKKLVISMEKPIDVSRRMRTKRSTKFSPINSTGNTPSKLEKQREDAIKRDGIYIITDKESKKVKMPKYEKMFEIMTKNRIEKPERADNHSKKRHINVAGSHPLATMEHQKKRKRKPKPKANTNRSPIP
jgi:hypothetical protein